jgi:hypothetical protein
MFLSLLLLVAQNRIAANRAAVLADICSLLLRSLSAIDREASDELRPIMFGPQTPTRTNRFNLHETARLQELSRIMAISQKRSMLCNRRGQQRYYREAIRPAQTTGAKGEAAERSQLNE